MPPVSENHETSVGQGRIRTAKAPLVWPVWDFGWSKSEGLERFFFLPQGPQRGGYELWR